jgi:hypothetical protein
MQAFFSRFALAISSTQYGDNIHSTDIQPDGWSQELIICTENGESYIVQDEMSSVLLYQKAEADLASLAQARPLDYTKPCASPA